MNTRDTAPDALTDVEHIMHQMLAGRIEPRAGSRMIWEIAFTHTPDSPDPMWGLWLMWGALTDWLLVKPEEEPSAKRAMLRASREWLALPRGDKEARDAYLDRWVHGELGISRKHSG